MFFQHKRNLFLILCPLQPRPCDGTNGLTRRGTETIPSAFVGSPDPPPRFFAHIPRCQTIFLDIFGTSKTWDKDTVSSFDFICTLTHSNFRLQTRFVTYCSSQKGEQHLSDQFIGTRNGLTVLGHQATVLKKYINTTVPTKIWRYGWFCYDWF